MADAIPSRLDPADQKPVAPAPKDIPSKVSASVGPQAPKKAEEFPIQHQHPDPKSEGLKKACEERLAKETAERAQSEIHAKDAHRWRKPPAHVFTDERYTGTIFVQY